MLIPKPEWFIRYVVKPKPPTPHVSEAPPKDVYAKPPVVSQVHPTDLLLPIALVIPSSPVCINWMIWSVTAIPAVPSHSKKGLLPLLLILTTNPSIEIAFAGTWDTNCFPCKKSSGASPIWVLEESGTASNNAEVSLLVWAFDGTVQS